MSMLDAIDLYAAFLCYFVGGVLSAGAGFWIARFGARQRSDRAFVIAACFLTAVWCALAAAVGSSEPITIIAETLRNLAFIAVIFRLFSIDGRDESLRPIRPVLVALILVQLFQPVLLILTLRAIAYGQAGALAIEVASVLNMLVAIGAVVLLHNLYAGAAASARPVLRWVGAALAAIFAYDLNFFTFAYLTERLPEGLAAFRGIFTGAMTVLFAVGTSASGANLQLRPSRTVTFQTLSLLVISSYLLVMVFVTRSLVAIGGDMARAGQVAFLVLGVVVAAAWLPSKRVRGWLRVTAAKHLFQHRYDYREEWLRFTETIGRGTNSGATFHERAVKAIADITESPAGLLLVSNEEAQLQLSTRWNWQTIDVPAVAGEHALSSWLEEHGHIVDLDEVRSGIEHQGELAIIPDWLREASDVWALVPLIHFDRLVGAIVLAKPRISRRLDWEDFDLLGVVGQQLASYLAEQAGQQALMEATRFDEFNRRMAFVMHDIKNLASQMSLLSANAQKHADNPDFRADMLVTLRNSSEKLSALLARLGRYGSGVVAKIDEVDLSVVAANLRERYRGVHPIVSGADKSVTVMADIDALEQALVHLVQNAADASGSNEPIVINVGRSGLTGQIEIIDGGQGMSPEFVRNGLFKPFVSSKDGGFGIGAFEAREMIKAMGGRVTVDSREGVGTRFSIALPVSETKNFSPKTTPMAEISDEVA